LHEALPPPYKIRGASRRAVLTDQKEEENTMHRKLPLKAALSLATLALTTGLALADTIAETDTLDDPAATNNAIAAAQTLKTANGEAVVPGWLGSSAGTQPFDADFYQFEAEAGSKVTIAVTRGLSGGKHTQTDLGIFEPNAATLTGWKRKVVIDGASVDPRYELDVTQTGTYTVAVTHASRTFMADGRVSGGTGGCGDYTLAINGLPITVKPIKQVDLNAKAWPGMVGKLNAKNRGNVFVAVLSSEDFDPMQVDKDSLTFGVTGDEDSLRSCKRKARDLNDDNKPDLVCRFVLAETGISPDKLEVLMKGKTLDGEEFQGSAAVSLISKHAKKKGHDHEDDDDDDEYEDHKHRHKHDHMARRR
jgi:hypothetical protein